MAAAGITTSKVMSMFPEGYEEHRKQLEAESHDQRRRHDRFVAEMKPDQLKTFIEMLMCFDGEDGKGYVNFMLGRSAAVMEFVHNMCPGCGEDHMSTDKLDAIRAEQGFPTLAETLSKIEPVVPIDKAPYITPPKYDPVHLAEYGMEYDPATDILRCINCKLGFISMDDRMLRAPKEDGCHGCHVKSATG